MTTRLLLIVMMGCGGVPKSPDIVETDTDTDADADSDADSDADTDTDVPSTAPVAVDDAFTVDEGEAGVRLEPLLNDTDPNDAIDVATLTLVDDPLYGIVDVRPDGNVSYSHDGSEVAYDSFTYTVDDTSGETSNIATVSISVDPVNDPPEAFDDFFVVDEGGFGVLDLAFNDTDADDGIDLATIVIVMQPAYGQVSVNADGTVDYTHDGSETLVDSFGYSIADNSGAASNTGLVSLTINPINDGPIAVDDLVGLVPGGVVDVAVFANDIDPDDGLDLASVAIVTPAANGTLLANFDGTVTYTHDNGPSIADSFTYTIDDFVGVTSNIATVDLEVGADPVVNNLLVVHGNASADYVTCVVNGLAPYFAVVTAIPDTPTPFDLAGHDAVLVYNNGAHTDPVGLGDVMADWFDVNGHVVEALYGTGGLDTMSGRWASDGYSLLSGNWSSTAVNIGVVAEPASPLMVDVNALSATRSVDGNVINGGIAVASYDNGMPMVVRGTINGHDRVDLGLFPGGCWGSYWIGDGFELMRNAVEF